jgi:hypothetical protein
MSQSHLIAKPITDVNGVQKTVRVKPSGIAPVTISRVSSVSAQENIPVPSRDELRRIDNLPVDEKARYARRLTIAPEILEMLGSSKNPAIRNEISMNKKSSQRALMNVVDAESSTSRFNKGAEKYRDENLINVAMHPNTSTTALRKIASIKRGNGNGRDIAEKRLRGEDYLPKKRVNSMATRSYHTGFWE